jgi:hypothetical protein
MDSTVLKAQFILNLLTFRLVEFAQLVIIAKMELNINVKTVDTLQSMDLINATTVHQVTIAIMSMELSLLYNAFQATTVLLKLQPQTNVRMAHTPKILVLKDRISALLVQQAIIVRMVF